MPQDDDFVRGDSKKATGTKRNVLTMVLLTTVGFLLYEVNRLNGVMSKDMIPRSEISLA